MATELAKAYVQIVPSAQGIQGSISSVMNGEGTAAGEKTGKNFASSFAGMAKKALVGLGIGKIISDAIGSTSEFETAMAKASTLFKGSEAEFSDLQSTILGLSSTYGVAATTLAEAAYSAESASVPMEQLGPMLESSAKLATAGFTDIDTALSATAKTMNAYGDAAMSIEDIQKVLIQTQNLGITTVGELGASLANVTPTAAAMGVSFDQVGAAMAQMTAQGVPTAQATTQLRSAMTELGKQGTKADKAFRAAAKGTKYAGMSFQEAMAKGANLGDVFGMMQAYADKTGKSMVDLWGSVEAGNAAMMIASDVDTFNSNLEQMATDADVVGEAYGKMADTFGNDMNRLKESAKNFMTTLFEGGDISGAFDSLLASAGDIGERLKTWLVNGLTALGQNLPQMVSSLFDFGAGLLESLAQVDWISVGTTLLNGIIGGLGTLGQKLIELVGGAVKSLINGEVDFGKIGTAIWNGVTSVITTAGGWLKTLFETAKNAICGENGIDFSGIGTKILDGIKTVLDEAGKFLAELFGFGRDAAANGDEMGYGSIGTSIMDGVKGVLEEGGNFLKGIFADGVQAAKDEPWPSVGEVIKTGVNLALNGCRFLSSAFEAGARLIEAIDWESVGRSAGDLIVTGLDAANKIVGAVGSAAVDLLTNISWEQIGKGISDILVNGLDIANRLLSVVGSAAVDLLTNISWDNIGKGISAILVTGLDAANKLLGAFSKGAYDLITGINWKNIGSSISGLIVKGVDSANKLVSTISTAADELLTGIKWENIGAGISELLNKGLSSAGSVLTDITSFLSGVFGGAGDLVQGAGSFGKDVLTGAGEAFKNWITGTDYKSAADDLKNAIAELKQAIEDGKDAVRTAAEDLSSEVKTGLLKYILKDEIYKAAKPSGEGLMSGIKVGIGRKEYDLNTKVKEVRKDWCDLVKDDTTWNTAGKSIMDSIKSGIEAKEETLTNQATSIAENIDAKYLAYDWNGTGKYIIGTIATGVSLDTTFTTEMRNQAAAGMKAFTDIEWNNVGTQIVAGIVSGVNASAGTLTSRLEQLARNALAAAKRMLGINSPSKVMRDEVGRWIPEGIAEGIENGRSMITNAMNDVTGQMMGPSITGSLTAGGNQIGAMAAQGSVYGESDSFFGRIVEAIRQGMESADIPVYMDGRKVSDEVNRFLGNDITARRFA